MFRTVALLCTGLALAGCASYQQQVLGSLSSEPAASASEPAVQTARLEVEPERLPADAREPAEDARPRRTVRRAAPASPTAEPGERRPSVDELAQVKKSTADQPRQPEASRLSTLPRVGSPEWEKQQAEIEQKEKRLDQMIRSICRGC